MNLTCGAHMSASVRREAAVVLRSAVTLVDYVACHISENNKYIEVSLFCMVLFTSLIIHLFQFIFSAEIVFSLVPS